MDLPTTITTNPEDGFIQRCRNVKNGLLQIYVGKTNISVEPFGALILDDIGRRPMTFRQADMGVIQARDALNFGIMIEWHREDRPGPGLFYRYSLFWMPKSDERTERICTVTYGFARDGAHARGSVTVGKIGQNAEDAPIHFVSFSIASMCLRHAAEFVIYVRDTYEKV